MSYAGPFIALVWPTLLSAVAVFIVSSLMHMVSSWHRSDYVGLPDEDGFRKAVTPMKIPPGDYFVPKPGGMAQMKDPAFIAKLTDGPRIVMTVMPNGVQSMGGPLIGWFIYSIVVNAIAGHIAWATIPRGAPYRLVFHTVALAAFAGYSLALWQARVWFGRSLSTTVKGTIDGLIYGIVTAGVFGWMWPK
ncbi:MAG TPA: hypothetical protein VF483_08405 [Gemmatimonadaceae bacterium]